MVARRVSLVVVAAPALALGRAAALRAQSSAPAAWQATPASVLKSALRSRCRRPGALSAPPRAATRRRSRPSALRPDAGVRVDILVAGRQRLAGQGDAPGPAGTELRRLRRLARRRRGASDRRRPRDGGRRRHPALRPDAVGRRMASSRRDAAAAGSADDLDGPGVEMGGGLAVGGCRPRLHPLLGALDHRRAAGALDRRARPPRIPPGPSATRSSSPPPSPTRTAASLPGVQRGLDQHRHLGGVGGQRRAPSSPARPARRRSWPRPAATSRRRASWSAPGPRPSASSATRCSGCREDGDPALVARVVDARRHPVPGQTHRVALGRPLRGRRWTARAGVTAVDAPAARRSRVRAAISPPSSRSRSIRCPPPSRSRPATASARRPGSGSPSRCARRSSRAAGGRWPASSVRFGVADGDRARRPRLDTSDADGIVQAVWTLGDRPGPPAAARSGGRRCRRSPPSSPPTPIRSPDNTRDHRPRGRRGRGRR